MSTSPSPKRSAGLNAKAAAAGVTAALVMASSGASLNTNLVVNGDFETVTGATATGALVTGWTGGNFGAPSGDTPFAYNYAAGYDNRLAGAVPSGNVASSNSDYYWSMNGGSANDDAFQIINLSAGDTGAAILAGTAQYDIRAFFSGYLNDLETGRLSLQFINSSNLLIGNVINFDAGNDFWNEVGGTGTIPTAATSALITLTRNPASGLSSGPDIYVDNVSFTVASIPEPSGLLISIASAGLLMIRRKRL